jgi:hypothetical protein
MCPNKLVWELNVSYIMLAHKFWLAMWLTCISQCLNNFCGVESKNADAYIKERRKRNRNIRYTMNVIYTFSFVEM